MATSFANGIPDDDGWSWTMMLPRRRLARRQTTPIVESAADRVAEQELLMWDTHVKLIFLVHPDSLHCDLADPVV